MNAIELFLKRQNLRPVELARMIGRSRSHISHLLADRRSLGKPAAIAIYRTTGEKLGPIAGLSDSDIEVLERVGGAA